jgi:dolichol kinase
MAHALALDSRDIALELHGLLRDLDPARWRDELETAARQRLEEIQDQVVELQESFEQRAGRTSDETLKALNDTVDSLSAMIGEHMPADGLSVTDLRQEWMSFRESMQPAYEGLADTLRRARIHVPSLRPTNYARNIFHVAAALLCIVLVEWVLSPGFMKLAAFSTAMSAWTMEIGKRRSARVDRLTWWVFGKMGHPYERHRVNSATWYSSALLLLSLTGSQVTCAVALAVMGVADPAAGLIGRRLGRIKLVHGRSLEGTAAFVVFGALASLGVLQVWHPDLGLTLMIGVTVAAVLPAALAELLAYRIDDNLLVPAAAAAGALVFLLVTGTPLN